MYWYSSEPNLDPPEYDEPEQVEDTGSVEICMTVRALPDDTVEFIKDESLYYYESENVYRVKLFNPKDIEDELFESIVDDVPSEPGLYLVEGDAYLDFIVSFNLDKYGDYSYGPEVERDPYNRSIRKENLKFTKIGD